jgi:hypothetical protein
MGRPLGPSGGRDPGGGGTGRPEGLSGGRAARWRSTVSGGACAAGAGAAEAGAVGAAAAGASVAGAGAWGGAEAGAGAAAAGAAGAAGGAGAGGGVGRLLLMRRDERAAGASDAAGAAGAAGAPAVPDPAAAGAETGRAAAFLTGPLLGAELLDTDVSGRRAGAPPVPPSSVPGVGGADFAALVALAAFLAGAGSSGWTGRRKPSASALRRTRSACASSMEDEWLFTPIPRERASSSPSLLVRPSSLASS